MTASYPQIFIHKLRRYIDAAIKNFTKICVTLPFLDMEEIQEDISKDMWRIVLLIQSFINDRHIILNPSLSSSNEKKLTSVPVLLSKLQTNVSALKPTNITVDILCYIQQCALLVIDHKMCK